MKNILAALFAGCLTMSIAAVVIVIGASPTDSMKPTIVRPSYDRAGNDVIDAAVARQLAAAKARVAAVQQREALASATIAPTVPPRY